MNEVISRVIFRHLGDRRSGLTNEIECILGDRLEDTSRASRGRRDIFVWTVCDR